MKNKVSIGMFMYENLLLKANKYDLLLKILKGEENDKFNKTMKVIDLLNKIANGEETPKRIRVLGNEFEYDNYDLKYRNIKKDRDNLLEHIGFYKGIVLNDEVEIIEDTPKEDKKIEKLDLSDWWEITSSEDYKPEMLANIFNKNAKAFSSKINEIIDKINEE